MGSPFFYDSFNQSLFLLKKLCISQNKLNIFWEVLLGIAGGFVTSRGTYILIKHELYYVISLMTCEL